MGMTAQRRIILEIIQSQDRHMTAEEVYGLARQRMPAIGLGTVYRNLNYLAQAGEVWRFSVPGEPDHFDRNTVRHGHVVCVRCKKISDLPLPEGILLPDLPGDFQGRVLDCELVVRCVCVGCQEESR